MKQYLCIPLYLTLKIDPTRHTIQIGEHWKDHKHQLQGNVQGMLCASKEASVRAVKEMVVEYVKVFHFFRQTLLSDWVLTYTVLEFGDNGLGYTTPHFEQRVKLG